MKEIGTYIETADIELAILYISQLAKGMVHGVFADETADGVLDTLPPFEQQRTGKYTTAAEQGINAREWILNNYEAAAGAFGLISVTTDIISRTLIDHDITYRE